MYDATDRARRHAEPLILLVDDEEDILPEYQDFLELEGYESITCSDPERATPMVMCTPRIALVITDLRMAKLDGVSLIRQLRLSVPQDRPIKFIILTGDATSQICEDIADVPVFIKPADSDALLGAIRAALAPSL